ncbi:alpha-ribazole phosphatase [Desulfogranum mediterraneum]|uniref:alpha-ribazole phosphatase n=1 Tax=Desulfogranum mediterraneum TaxID=160661 RepID=UPI0003F9A042|nr:alpha-ribazole phosphatase [Desulfogranum mediterraneum]
MSATRLYLIRHGQTEQNRTGVLMGSTDTPLNDHGRQQARYLSERVNALEVDTIFSSPLQRATETATLVFGREQPIITDSCLQEYHFGEWEGLHFTEIEQNYPEAWQMWLTNWDQTKIPGAETFAGFTQRVVSFTNELVAANPGKQLAVVSHGGCIRSLLAHYFSESVSAGYWKFKVDNATLTEIEFLAGMPILVRFNYR